MPKIIINWFKSNSCSRLFRSKTTGSFGFCLINCYSSVYCGFGIYNLYYKDQSYFPLEKRYNERPQSAMVVIDNKKGAVVALVGGAGETLN